MKITTLDHRNLLMGLGLIPFIACATLLSFGINTLGLLGSVSFILMSYTLAIIAFMSGVLWGQALSQFTSLPLKLCSNAIVIVAWLTFLCQCYRSFMVIAIIAFIVLVVIDGYLYRDKVIDKGYLICRIAITTVVIISLIVAF